MDQKDFISKRFEEASKLSKTMATPSLVEPANTIKATPPIFDEPSEDSVRQRQDYSKSTSHSHHAPTQKEFISARLKEASEDMKAHARNPPSSSTTLATDTATFVPIRTPTSTPTSTSNASHSSSSREK